MDGDRISEQATETQQVNPETGTKSVRREVVTDGKADSKTVFGRVVWYIFGFIIILILARLVMLLLGANQGSPFVDFIYGFSGIFVMPFYGIFGQPTYGTSVFETASVVAIVVYALLAWGIAKLATITNREV